MKRKCPLCHGSLTKLEEGFGAARRFRCDRCGRVSWISASRHLQMTFFECVFLLLLILGLIRYVPRDLHLPLYLDTVIMCVVAAATSVLMRRLHELLLDWFVPAEPFPELSPTVAIRTVELPFLETIGEAVGIRVTLHIGLLGTILLVAAFIPVHGVWGWKRLASILALVWGMLAVVTFATRCPRCRQRVLPLNLTRWPEVFRAMKCPRCGVRPRYKPRLIEPRTWRSRIFLPALYAAALAAAIWFATRHPPQPKSAQLETPVNDVVRSVWE